jgi:hypothetical protein
MPHIRSQCPCERLLSYTKPVRTTFVNLDSAELACFDVNAQTPFEIPRKEAHERMITRLILILALSALLFGATVPAMADWYVIQNKVGTTKLTDKKPGLGWMIIDGPYRYWDQAARSGRISPTPPGGRMFLLR